MAGGVSGALLLSIAGRLDTMNTSISLVDAVAFGNTVSNGVVLTLHGVVEHGRECRAEVI
jgi:hypothetical protein